jgi:hypothetical protein
MLRWRSLPTSALELQAAVTRGGAALPGLTHSGPGIAIGTSACAFSTSRDDWSSRASRFHAGRLHDRRGGRRGQESQQYPGGVRLACGRDNSRRNDVHGLQLGRQGPEQLGARNRHDLADQLDTELGFAACHDFGIGRGRRPGIQDRLGFDLFGDTQAIENLLEMDAARSADRWVGIDDRSGGEERALEGFDRSDVRLRRSRANRNANTNAGEGQFAIGRDLALLDEGFDDGSAGHRDIHDLTVEDAPPDLGRWRENDRDLVLAGALERPREFG